jgi:MFS family permease
MMGTSSNCGEHIVLGVPQSQRRILLASLVGTTIEFYDFYVYATAAALVFPKLFFPSDNPTSAALRSLVTFSLAFLARPVGSALFGHFGDRVGRKATLVAALLTMGSATVLIGALPRYTSIGIGAPLLLALCRIGQGLGLGGEWGGAVLLAVENAPPEMTSRYGMFPQLGAPIGLFCSTGIFLLLSQTLNDTQFLEWGWRIPFLCSAPLVFLGLYVRLRLSETPEFQQATVRGELIRTPLLAVLKRHRPVLLLGTFAATTVFVLFYLMTVFCVSWATSGLGFPRASVLVIQLFGALTFASMIPVSATLADRVGCKSILAVTTLAIMVFGFCFSWALSSSGFAGLLVFSCVGLGLVGLAYGPLGTLLARLFPVQMRYTGASLTFNLAGILGASCAPYIATSLTARFGVASAGYYLSGMAILTLIALYLLRLQSRQTEGAIAAG